ncbi:MAG: sigma-54 dependent transcriptional regulator [FCB group bacterium]|jgi:DNA-binding NtrC family response regulator|nr:sigma-54 dependent transcriptional regulator [FCB group bacterium]
MQTVLAVDDELSVRQAYRFILGRAYQVLVAENGEDALEVLNREHVDIILLDMVMPGMGGLDLLTEIQLREISAPVVVVTASQTTGLAEEALRRGAAEYFAKPFDVHQLELVVRRTLREAQTRRELMLLRQSALRGTDTLLGDSPAMRETLLAARAAMQADTPVLILGENGAGKRTLARAIHAGSPRADAPLITVPCSGVETTLVESELFGSECELNGRREGRIRAAGRGTVLLDEVGDLPHAAQTRLLRTLRDGAYSPVSSDKLIPVRSRILAATRQDLRERVRQRAFQEPLLELLGATTIAVPPLRRRREDIPVLVAHFLARYAPRAGAKTHSLSAEALAILSHYPWPGNVRELENIIERLVFVHGAHELITPGHLSDILPVQAKVELQIAAGNLP